MGMPEIELERLCQFTMLVDDQQNIGASRPWLVDTSKDPKYPNIIIG